MKRKPKPKNYWTKAQLYQLYLSLKSKLKYNPRASDFQRASGSAYIALLRQYKRYQLFLQDNNFNFRDPLPVHIHTRQPFPKVITKEDLINYRKQGFVVNFQITYRRQAENQLFFCNITKYVDGKSQTQYKGWVSRELMKEFVTDQVIKKVEQSNKNNIAITRILDKIIEQRKKSDSKQAKPETT